MSGFLGLGRALDRLRLGRLKEGLTKTRAHLGAIFAGRRLDDAWFDDVETALLTADAGTLATQELLANIRQEVKARSLNNDSPAEALQAVVADCITRALSPLIVSETETNRLPKVVMVAGVNGAGKTTSIGKLAHTWKAEGKKILLGAGDTFRAAAREQLIVWGERNAVDGGEANPPVGGGQRNRVRTALETRLVLSAAAGADAASKFGGDFGENHAAVGRDGRARQLVASRHEGQDGNAPPRLQLLRRSTSNPSDTNFHASSYRFRRWLSPGGACVPSPWTRYTMATRRAV
jgi:hypothetical protein